MRSLLALRSYMIDGLLLGRFEAQELFMLFILQVISFTESLSWNFSSPSWGRNTTGQETAPQDPHNILMHIKAANEVENSSALAN